MIHEIAQFHDKNKIFCKKMAHIHLYMPFFFISNTVTSRTPTRLHRPTSKLQCSTAASNNYLPKIIKNASIF